MPKLVKTKYFRQKVFSVLSLQTKNLMNALVHVKEKRVVNVIKITRMIWTIAHVRKIVLVSTLWLMTK